MTQLPIKTTTQALFGAPKSTSFNCQYKHGGWDSLGTFYFCEVQNFVNITSEYAAKVDSIYGRHEPGYNYDNVNFFYISSGEIYYFPRGLNDYFENLKGIQIAGVGLKEIHQSDLKAFPNLIQLLLQRNNLEVLEENLFKFNPNLEKISFEYNKISYIDPNVFEKLTKLKTLDFDLNTCIDMNADNNQTEVQNIIRTATSQCSSSDYSKLEKKVKRLEIRKKNLTSKRLKQMLQNLEKKVKNSKISNTFYHRLQNLKAVQLRKAQYEATLTTTTPRITTTTQAPTTTAKRSRFNGCSVLESKVDRLERKIKEQNQKFEEIGENLRKIMKVLDIGY